MEVQLGKEQNEKLKYIKKNKKNWKGRKRKNMRWCEQKTLNHKKKKKKHGRKNER